MQDILLWSHTEQKIKVDSYRKIASLFFTIIILKIFSQRFEQIIRSTVLRIWIIALSVKKNNFGQ